MLLPIGWQINRFVVWLYYLGRSLGIPDFVTIPMYEFGLNVLLFAAPAALASLLWSRIKWWGWPLLALGASLAVEIVQLVALPREFSFLDIVANTLGALIGAVALIRPSRRESAR
ncbi:glycopeptide antibiotics resistance protein [Leucobacter exalbidus]|uniref:Glycopeptide antibiotics resistance protein n=1 Tax=Leucobacter exalbidus TaxID=662960 RepID=A0A940T0U2_9MICO|nr:glycopeptide antibiotics resistance protein [Leucobacter exalbidus]